jgi:hypothetical protein
MMDLSTNSKDAINDLRAAAEQRAKAAREVAEEARLVLQLWDDFVRYLERDWPFHLLALVQKESNVLKKMRSENHAAIPALEEAHRVAKEKVDSSLRRYPSHLEEAFRHAHLPLDSDSRHPRYSVDNKFFQIEIDEQRKMARLSNHEGRLTDLPADIGAVLELVQREHKRVFDRQFDGKKFLKQLRAQYVAILKKDKQTDGASVPIRQITRRLGKNLKGFRSDEFLVDLSRLVESGPMEIDGCKLDLQQTKDTNQGMLLYGTAGRGYIGFVVFRKA